MGPAFWFFLNYRPRPPPISQSGHDYDDDLQPAWVYDNMDLGMGYGDAGDEES